MASENRANSLAVTGWEQGSCVLGRLAWALDASRQRTTAIGSRARLMPVLSWGARGAQNRGFAGKVGATFGRWISRRFPPGATRASVLRTIRAAAPYRRGTMGCTRRCRCSGRWQASLTGLGIRTALRASSSAALFSGCSPVARSSAAQGAARAARGRRTDRDPACRQQAIHPRPRRRQMPSPGSPESSPRLGVVAA